MNGKQVKTLKKTAVLIYIKEVKPILEKALESDELSKEQKQHVVSKLPTLRQIYRGLKRGYHG